MDGERYNLYCPYCRESEQRRQERLQQLEERIEEIDTCLEQEIEKLTEEEIQRKKDQLAELERKKAEEEKKEAEADEERQKKEAEAKRLDEERIAAEEEEEYQAAMRWQAINAEEERKRNARDKANSDLQTQRELVNNFNENLLKKLKELIDGADHKITTMCSLNLIKTARSGKKAIDTLHGKLDQLGTDLNRQMQEHFTKLDENHQRGNYEQNSILSSNYYSEQSNRGREFEQQFMDESNAIVAKLLDKKFANVTHFCLS